MTHWPFVLAAYAIAISALTALTFASFTAMRHAERRAEALRRDR
ncbi:heme exporter protein CcmD [Sphingomonas sp. ID0503]